LIGAHIGSFDVMRLAADRHSPLRVHFLTETSNAPQINALLQTLAPTGEESKVSVLPVHSGQIGHALRIRRHIKRGEVVAMLADRCHPHERERSTEVDFLGARASLPTGPISLAGTLLCPVLFMVAIRTGPQRYDIHVEEFAERVTLPRGQRAEAIQKYCQQYADRLAAYCHEAPDQWFNFYDFWSRKGPHENR
jgi:predicted LPLAT superfamily acyltransferase